MSNEHTSALEGAVEIENLSVIRGLNLHLKLAHISATLTLAEVGLFFGLEIGLLILSTFTIGACQVHLVLVLSLNSCNSFQLLNLLLDVQTTN